MYSSITFEKSRVSRETTTINIKIQSSSIPPQISSCWPFIVNPSLAPSPWQPLISSLLLKFCQFQNVYKWNQTIWIWLLSVFKYFTWVIGITWKICDYFPIFIFIFFIFISGTVQSCRNCWIPIFIIKPDVQILRQIAVQILPLKGLKEYIPPLKMQVRLSLSLGISIIIKSNFQLRLWGIIIDMCLHTSTTSLISPLHKFICKKGLCIIFRCLYIMQSLMLPLVVITLNLSRTLGSVWTLL